MKKYILFFAATLTLSFGFTSCDVDTDEEAGGINIEKMCGYWEVTYDAVDEDGNVVYEDPYGIGSVALYTYNVSDNSTSQMWLDDRGNFWNYKFLVDIDYSSRAFSADLRNYDSAGTGQTSVSDGKVLEGATLNTHGMPNDSIVFYIYFNDDDYVTEGYWAGWRVSGHRFTGFSSDSE